MNFWEAHSLLFLLSMLLFPRLTMLFATSAPFGLLHWLGWAFMPRLTAAILATTFYWQTNTLLCVAAWITAFWAQQIQARKCAQHMQYRYHRTLFRLRHRYF